LPSEKQKKKKSKERVTWSIKQFLYLYRVTPSLSRQMFQMLPLRRLLRVSLVIVVILVLRWLLTSGYNVMVSERLVEFASKSPHSGDIFTRTTTTCVPRCETFSKRFQNTESESYAVIRDRERIHTSSSDVMNCTLSSVMSPFLSISNILEHSLPAQYFPVPFELQSPRPESHSRTVSHRESDSDPSVAAPSELPDRAWPMQSYSRSSCRRMPHTDPICGGMSQSERDHTNVCHFSNVCMHVKPNNAHAWMYFQEGFNDAIVDPPPVLGKSGEELRFQRVRTSIQQFAAMNRIRTEQVFWHDGPHVLWNKGQFRGREYYQQLVDELGSLLWLVYDVTGFQPGNEATIVWSESDFGTGLSTANWLWDAAASSTQSAAVHARASDMAPKAARLDCFSQLSAGYGCRSLWWDPDRFTFKPPLWVDFMPLDPTNYTTALQQMQSRLSLVSSITPDLGSRIPGEVIWRRLMFAIGLCPASSCRIPTNAEQYCRSRHETPHIVLVARDSKRRIRNIWSLVDALLNQLHVRITILIPSSASVPSSVCDKSTRSCTVIAYDMFAHDAVRLQARVLSKASMLLGVHGAALTNLIFMPPGGTVVELFGHQHINTAFQVLARQFSHHYAAWRPDLDDVHHGSIAQHSDCSPSQPLSAECKHNDILVNIQQVVHLCTAQLQSDDP
jgi:Glycosyltransferase 61